MLVFLDGPFGQQRLARPKTELGTDPITRKIQKSSVAIGVKPSGQDLSNTAVREKVKNCGVTRSGTQNDVSVKLF